MKSYVEIDMPKTCEQCPFHDKQRHFECCLGFMMPRIVNTVETIKALRDGKFNPEVSRLPFCPLTPGKTPYQRQIDLEHNRLKKRCWALEKALKIHGNCGTCQKAGTVFHPCDECGDDYSYPHWEFAIERYEREADHN